MRSFPVLPCAAKSLATDPRFGIIRQSSSHKVCCVEVPMPRLEDLPYPIASLFEEMLDQPDPSFRFVL